MFSVDWDLAGLWKVLVMGGTLIFVIWMHQISGILVWLVAAYYCAQAHDYWNNGMKPYMRLGGHLKKAVKS